MDLSCMPKRPCKPRQRRSTHIPVPQRGQNMGQAKRIISSREERNKAAPSLKPDIFHRITLCRKGQPLRPPPSLPTPVATSFKKQTNIGWIQTLMGLIFHDWAEVQNTYLRSLGTKISGVRWISALIRKLWDTAWEIWNFSNHTLHATDGSQK